MDKLLLVLKAANTGRRGGQYGNKNAAREHVHAFEKEIRVKDWEEAGIFKPDTGERLAYIPRGSVQHGFSLTDEQKAMVRGNILTHNHPDSYNLSIDDLQAAVNYGAHEIRAAAKDYTYSVRPPKTIKPNWDWADEFGNDYDAAELKMRQQLWGGYPNKKTSQQWDTESTHRALLAFTKRNPDWIYRREKNRD